MHARPTALIATLPLLAGCAVPVVEDVGERDAAELTNLLEAAGVGVAREATSPGNATLLVAYGDAARAMDAVRSSPRAPRAGLIPTERDVHAERERVRAREVERALMALPEVRRATVTLALPMRDPLSGAAPLPPRATAVVEGGASTERVRELVAACVDGLTSDHVFAVVTLPRPPRLTPALARVGPFVVAAHSAAPLRATLAFFLGSMAIASSLLAWSRLRRRA